MSASSRTFRGTGDTDELVGTTRAEGIPAKYSALYQLVATDRLPVGTIARLTLGIVMFPHAAQKTLGWFGGPGFARAYEGFTESGLPGVIAGAVILAELFASILLIVGAFTRVAAFAIMTIMIGAIFLVQLPNGFWMNWSGRQAGEGFEYHLLAIGLALVAIIVGGGVVSVDRALMKLRPTEERASLGEPVTVT